MKTTKLFLNRFLVIEPLIMNIKRRALQLASEHDIDLAAAYQIVAQRITLDEVLRRKQDKRRKQR